MARRHPGQGHERGHHAGAHHRSWPASSVYHGATLALLNTHREMLASDTQSSRN
ncbi:MAG: hypothetical protein R3F27_12440 [Gammaproteobacteria bacterium]